MNSLRAQITVSAVLLVAAAVALSGVVIAVRIDHQDRAQVDRQLRARAERVRQDEAKARANGTSLLGENGGPGQDTGLLAGTDTVTRVLSGGRVVAQRGEGIADGVSVAASPGLSSVAIRGQAWRSFTAPTTAVADGRLQVLQSLEPVEQRLAANGRLIGIVASLATLVTASAVWLVAGLVLRPLDRLRAGARSVRPGADQRLPEPSRPLEIAELSATLNAMLERLETSMRATRRFTADAGHELRTPMTSLGADLETLSQHPDIPPGRRADILEAMTREHARVVAVLDGLQRLARGDAEALPDSVVLDVGAVVADAVADARRRHPEVTFVAGELEPALLHGWVDGIRLAVGNLLENGAVHGRPGGAVSIATTVADGTVRIDVSDDGPGIAPEDRDRLRGRFARGVDARGPGSGLGLALVDQQARLHGGRLELADSESGGLRATLALRAVTELRPIVS